jgi:diguanylate cyclase (GGDEF)-like protein
MKRKRKGCLLVFCVSMILNMLISIPALAAESSAMELTQEEKEYLKGKEVLRVAVVDGWRPYMYKSSEGTYSGFALDLLGTLQEENGISIQYVEAEDYERALELLKDGQADIAAFMETEGLQEDTQKGFVPYMTAPLQMITGTGAVLFEDRSLKAAVPAGVDYINFDKYGNIERMEFPTLEDCLKSVEKKQTDFIISDFYTAESLTRYAIAQTIVIKNIPQAYVTIGFLTGESEGVLQGILEKLRGSISDAEVVNSLTLHGDRLLNEPKIIKLMYSNSFIALNGVFILIFLAVFILLLYMKAHAERQSELYGHEQSYQLLADTFGQAGMEYDFLNDRLVLFGNRHDEIDIPEVVENLHDKLAKRELRITLTKEEFDKFCLNSEPGKTYQTEFQCGMRGEGWNWFSMIYIVVGSEESRRMQRRLLGVLVDAQKQHQTQEKLLEIGQYDKLTKVFNRAGAEALLVQALQNLGEYSQNVFLLMDVDKFKQINDTYGHLYGDEVLRALGRNMQEIFQGDTIVSRWGGDEFIMFVRGPGAEDELLRKRVEELRRRMKEFQYDGVAYPIGLSISGVVPKKGISLQDLFKKADEMLYRIKQEGRDDFRIQ